MRKSFVIFPMLIGSIFSSVGITWGATPACIYSNFDGIEFRPSLVVVGFVPKSNATLAKLFKDEDCSNLAQGYFASTAPRQVCGGYVKCGDAAPTFAVCKPRHWVVFSTKSGKEDIQKGQCPPADECLEESTSKNSENPWKVSFDSKPGTVDDSRFEKFANGASFESETALRIGDSNWGFCVYPHGKYTDKKGSFPGGPLYCIGRGQHCPSPLACFSQACPWESH